MMDSYFSWARVFIQAFRDKLMYLLQAFIREHLKRRVRHHVNPETRARTSATILSRSERLPASARASSGTFLTRLRRLSICATRDDASFAEPASRASCAASCYRDKRSACRRQVPGARRR